MTVLNAETWLIDLDDTLYQSEEISKLVSDKIRAYMVAHLDFTREEVQERCNHFYLNYGTTLAGLVASGYEIDFDHWHSQVHATLDYEQFIKPDPALKQLLDSIPVPKYIFTNADSIHAERCLELMGMRDCFQGVICFETIMAAAEEQGMVHHNKPVVCKPNRHAFELALVQAGGADIATTAFFDDSTRNVASAHRMGIFSVLIGRTGVECASSAQLASMHDLPVHVPSLVEARQPQKTAAAMEGDGNVVVAAALVVGEKKKKILNSMEMEELMEERNKIALTVQA